MGGELSSGLRELLKSPPRSTNGYDSQFPIQFFFLVQKHINFKVSKYYFHTMVCLNLESMFRFCYIFTLS